MMNRNQIIEQLYRGKNFNDCINKMEPDHLRDDLKMEVMLILCECPDEQILQLHRDGKLEFYTVRIILNQIQSNTSPFFKKYRQVFKEFETSNWEIKDEHDVIDPDWQKIGSPDNAHSDHMHTKKVSALNKQDDPSSLDERQERENLEDRIMDEIDRLPVLASGMPYDSVMMRLYINLGSYRAMQEHTKIPFISCYKNIQKSMEVIRERLCITVRTKKATPLFTKGELEFIQNNKR